MHVQLLDLLLFLFYLRNDGIDKLIIGKKRNAHNNKQKETKR